MALDTSDEHDHHRVKFHRGRFNHRHAFSDETATWFLGEEKCMTNKSVGEMTTWDLMNASSDWTSSRWVGPREEAVCSLPPHAVPHQGVVRLSAVFDHTLLLLRGFFFCFIDRWIDPWTGLKLFCEVINWHINACSSSMLNSKVRHWDGGLICTPHKSV